MKLHAAWRMLSYPTLILRMAKANGRRGEFNARGLTKTCATYGAALRIFHPRGLLQEAM